MLQHRNDSRKLSRLSTEVRLIDVLDIDSGRLHGNTGYVDLGAVKSL